MATKIMTAVIVALVVSFLTIPSVIIMDKLWIIYDPLSLSSVKDQFEPFRVSIVAAFISSLITSVLIPQIERKFND
jgi:hypothetical protein